MRAGAIGAVIVGLATGCADGGDGVGEGLLTLGGDDASMSRDTADSGGSEGPGQTATSTPSTSAATAWGEDDSTSTGAADGSSEAGTTAAPTDDCASVVLEENFATGGLDRPGWSTTLSGNVAVDVVGGALEISADDPNGGGGFWLATAAIEVPPRGAAAFEVVHGPEAGLLWLGLVDGSREVHIDVLDGLLRATFRNPGDSGYQVAQSADFDPTQHRFVRVTYDADAPQLHTQTSPDGRTWVDFAEQDVSMFDFGSASLQVGSGLPGANAPSPVAAIDDLVLCSAD